MTTHELLELASLDALGLLDADERELFEHAFRAAPPALQAQIRREQLRLARIDDVLPDVEPPPGLRARVLAAVRDAIGSMTVRRIHAGAIVPNLRPAYGVSRLWRIGAIAAAAAALVLGFTTLQMRADYKGIESGLRDQAVYDNLLKEFGVRTTQAMYDPETRFVQFAPASLAGDDDAPVFAGRALLVVEAGARVGHLHLKDLPVLGAEYEVDVEDADGNVATAVITFRPSSTGKEFRELRNLAIDSTRSIAIRLRGESLPVLRSIRI